ncbi:MAG TPA: ribonucleotide reductase [Actinomycetota bacterium]|jgi:ribonucleoside-diphosphate reductase beta chain|nr:ribonucleotide reductase [Actinomycetota bacterium]
MAQTLEETKRFQIVEDTDLQGIGKVHIDEVIEYVHTGFKKLPTPMDLYARYLRQRWNVFDLDFSQDAIDWHEKMTEEEREAFINIASGFHHGERQVEVDLVPFMMAGSEEDKIFISSQIEDEARHTVFFDRFYREVVGIEGDGIMGILDGSFQWLTETFVGPFGLLAYLADDLRADPEDPHKRVKYSTLYHLWIEGVLALVVMKITLGFGRDRAFLPAYYTGFTATCRDEARHVQFGMKFLYDHISSDPTYAKDVLDVLQTLFNMGGAVSRLVYTEPLGFDILQIRQLMVEQLHRKLGILGMTLPKQMQEQLESLEPVIAGG